MIFASPSCLLAQSEDSSVGLEMEVEGVASGEKAWERPKDKLSGSLCASTETRWRGESQVTQRSDRIVLEL